MLMKRSKFIGIGILAAAASITLISYITKPEEETIGASSASSSTQTTSSGGSAMRLSDLALLPVSLQSKTIAVPVSGRVVPRHQTVLFAEVQGRILPSARLFKSGTSFRQGEVLLRINAREFALNLESQKSNFLNILTGMMPDLKADYPDNYRAWLAYVQEYNSGEPLPPLPQTTSEGEKYFITSNQVYSTYYSIKAQEERLGKYVIRAPYSGLVTGTQVDIGGMVSPGQPLGTIISSEQYELEAGVSLEAASRLSVGDQILFHSNEVAGNWTGKLVRINEVVDPSTQNVPVFFQIDGPQLRSGMYLEGAFAMSRYDSVFVIPQGVLARDESVLILENNVIVQRAVTPLAYLRDSVVVRGLDQNDQLILNQFSIPVEGKKVGL